MTIELPEPVAWHSTKSAALIAQRQWERYVNKSICGTGKTQDFSEPLFTAAQMTAYKDTVIDAAILEIERHADMTIEEVVNAVRALKTLQAHTDLYQEMEQDPAKIRQAWEQDTDYEGTPV